MKISIDPQLKKAAPYLRLGVISAEVEVSKHNEALWREIDAVIRKISGLKAEQLPHIPQVRGLRSVYRGLGKDPARYRGSSEALLRRIIQGKGLYKINTVVDINNLVSLETRHSVGVYDLDNVRGKILFRVGAPGEHYKGIGKEMINIEGLPVFTDEEGPFGSPTSDSERAMIKEGTHSIMMVIISFCEDKDLGQSLKKAVSLLRKYASARDVKTEVI